MSLYHDLIRSFFEFFPHSIIISYHIMSDPSQLIQRSVIDLFESFKIIEVSIYSNIFLHFVFVFKLIYKFADPRIYFLDAHFSWFWFSDIIYFSVIKSIWAKCLFNSSLFYAACFWQTVIDMNERQGMRQRFFFVIIALFQYSMCEDEFGDLHVQKNVPGEYGIGDKYNKPCHKRLGNVHYLNEMNQTG